MELKIDELIGINHWNAIGESIVGIMSKVSALNYFTWRDVRIAFLNNPKSAKIPLLTTDANTDWGINLDSIRELFNERIDVYKSFGEYYSPNRSYRMPTKQLLHICPKCAKLGKHLYIHQLEYLQRCPIHNQKLQSTCIKCDGFLGVFAIPENQNKNDIFNLFKCKKCGYENLYFWKDSKSENPIIVEKKVTLFLTEYQEWLRSCRLKYHSTNWNDTSSEFHSWELTMQLMKKPKLLNKYLHLKDKRFSPGNFKFHSELNSKAFRQPDFNYSKINTSESITELVMNLSVHAHIFIDTLRSQFAITDGQISMAKLTRRYSDIFRGESYSVWAVAYMEIKTALSDSFRTIEIANFRVYSNKWIIHCWYFYLVRWLQRKKDLKVVFDMNLLSSLSRVWLRKFLTQVFVDEVFRACSNLLEPPKLTWYVPVADHVDIEYGKFNSMLMENNAGNHMFTFWRSGPSITQLICLHKSGFQGYTNNKLINYKNYKTVHKIFAVKQEVLKFKDYNRMLGMHCITELRESFNL